MQEALQHFREQIMAAGENGNVLCLRGGASKQWYGESIDCSILDTRAYSGIVAYDPAELVITARCGTPLREIEAALNHSRQMLGFEPPHFSDSATIGGCVAAGLAGPRRMQAGAVRDQVLGTVVMNGKGEIMKFGGQVMKNVAGYDVSRLLAGSLGTLALMLEVSVKVSPQPACEATLRFEFDQGTSIRRMNEWSGQPLPISATAWQGGELQLRLSGAEAGVKSAISRLGGERFEAEQAAPFWSSIRELTADFFVSPQAGKTLWRLALPGTTPPLDLGGEPLIEWTGGQRWVWTDMDAELLRSKVTQAGGHATVMRNQPSGVSVFQAPSAPVMAIHRRLKQVFDPDNVFAGERLYPGMRG